MGTCEKSKWRGNYTMPRYPQIKIRLNVSDGFSIMGKVYEALKNANISMNEIREYQKEAMKSDYDHILQVSHEWIEIE